MTTDRRRALFDAWSADYDPAAEGAFPFGAYDAVLDRIAELVAERAPQRVLELGVGTGNLTRRILDRLPGTSIVGIDFSPGMVERAADAVPGIDLLEHDLHVLPFPSEAGGCDVAATSYVLHEFDDEHKLALLEALLDDTLRPGGACVIGDVCFPDAATREAAKALLDERWDPQEHYFAVEELTAAALGVGLRVSAEQLGSHAGVIFVSRL